MTLSPFRKRYLKDALQLINTPYIWGGKDSSGIDCSGVVTLSLYMATGGRIDWRFSHNTDLLWMKTTPTTDPRPGDWVFYGGHHEDGTPDPEHVMTYLLDGMVFGACNGNSTCITQAIAQQMDAKVRVKTMAQYRSDFLGYRRLPELPPVP